MIMHNGVNTERFQCFSSSHSDITRIMRNFLEKGVHAPVLKPSLLWFITCFYAGVRTNIFNPLLLLIDRSSFIVPHDKLYTSAHITSTELLPYDRNTFTVNQI